MFYLENYESNKIREEEYCLCVGLGIGIIWVDNEGEETREPLKVETEANPDTIEIRISYEGTFGENIFSFEGSRGLLGVDNLREEDC